MDPGGGGIAGDSGVRTILGFVTDIFALILMCAPRAMFMTFVHPVGSD